MNLAVNGVLQSRREVPQNLDSDGHPPLQVPLFFCFKPVDLLRSFLCLVSKSFVV
jgi:hypothetical protein